MRLDFKGPYLGFHFNGKHSSDLEIVRINTGSRADDLLSPTFKDTTAERTGSAGLLYFNTQIQQRVFTLNFAFEGLEEVQVRKIRQWFSPETVGNFWLDETPFKVYTVKINAQPKLSYLVFDEGLGKERIYKGEGSVSFSAFYPYAEAPYQTIEDYIENDICTFTESKEWLTASGILQRDQFITKGTKLYNPGDLESHFNFDIVPSTVVEDGVDWPSVQTTLTATIFGNNYNKVMVIKLPEQGSGIEKLTIDSELRLMYDQNKIVRNNLIEIGDFLKVPITTKEDFLTSSNIYQYSINCDGAQAQNINYKYLYY